MNVILLERLNNLGDLGDEVSVKPGFARNFLIPQQKAVQANAANREVFEARRADLEKNANDKLAVAQSRAEKLQDHIVTIMMKAGEEGRRLGVEPDAGLLQGQGLSRLCGGADAVPDDPSRRAGRFRHAAVRRSRRQGRARGCAWLRLPVV